MAGCSSHSRRAARRKGTRGMHPLCLAAAVAQLAAGALLGQSFTLSTMLGDLQIPLVHIDTGGSPLSPVAPGAPPFTPPAIFAAPLPSGSGARALGAAGAFTAIADDATAASWNPAGLIQLERAELSGVFRMKRETDRHASLDPDYRVGDDTLSSHTLNYLSAVAPVRLWNRNVVFAVNLQEVFDFSSRFQADFTQRSSSRIQQSHRTVTQARTQNHYALQNGFVDVTEMLTTVHQTTLDQRLSSTTLGRIEFDQDGSVQALTPAFACEITPSFSLGAALNLYLTGVTDAESIRTRTRARYTGTMESRVDRRDHRLTTGTYTYTGRYVNPEPLFPGGPTIEIDFGPESGDVPAYSTTETDQTTTRLHYEGYYDVYDRVDDFRGLNATFGALWAANARLSLGLCLDLPWRANGRQTKTVRSGVQMDGAPDSHESSTTAKDVTFDFPLYWAGGAAWRWTDRLTSSLDVSQTRWSDFAYQAEGDPRRNPFDGTPHGENRVDDCWAVRTGLEYIWVFAKTEIPLRMGFSHEQRPAVGSPDIYNGISLGSGLSLGQGANKVIIDVAYIYTRGRDVMGTLVPGQTGMLETDVDRHDLYISCIYHF